MQAIRSALRSRATTTTVRQYSSTSRKSFARMILTGRLAAEPELFTTSGGQEIVRYAVGTTSGPKDNRQTTWFRVANFQPEGPSREYLLGVPKGSLVLVEGDVSLRYYEDAEGKKHSNLSIIQRSFEVLKRGIPASASGEEGSEETPSE